MQKTQRPQVIDLNTISALKGLRILYNLNPEQGNIVCYFYKVLGYTVAYCPDLLNFADL
jgi:hypothetical protein